MTELEHDKKIRIRHAVRKAAQQLKLELEFFPSRRSSDLTFVVARGGRDRVQELPVRVLEGLSSEVDIELISLKHEEAGRYRVTFVVTDVLEHQQMQVEERRAKLRLVKRDLLKGS